MYNQPEVILEKYDLEVTQITKGRGAYICDTSCGMKQLKEFRGSAEKAEFLAGFLLSTSKAGFPVEQILPAKEGQFVVEDESGGRYLLKDMYQGSECSTHSQEDMKAAVQTLAAFHQISQKYPGEIPEFCRAGANELVELYEKHNRELVKVKNYVRSRKKKNEFERKFQENYAHFMENASQTIECLRQQKLDEGAYVFCHGDYNQHNVLRVDGVWRIVNFEWLSYNPAMMDLANFLRKMMEKNNWNPRLGSELIGAYESIRPLSDGEHQQLYLALAYPEKFWKLANHYFNSHKAWLSARDIEKLDKVIEQEEARLYFLENLFSFRR